MSGGEGQAAPPDAWGIVPGFEDADGVWQETSAATRDTLIEAMGGDPRADGPPTADDAVLILHQGTGHELEAPATLVTEDGTRREVGRTVPDDLPLGYHELRVAGRDEATRLIVSPGRCHLPDGMRWWGVAVQLYAAWSRGSEGIGDLADLRLLTRTLRDAGADAAMVNPLGAAVPTTPRDPSPYLPSSRRVLDWIHLRVAEVPGGADLDRVLPPPGGTIDHDAVAAAKLAALEQAFATAGHDHALDGWAEHADRAVHQFARWSVAAERHGADWRAWPADLRHPDGGGMQRLAQESPQRVRFHLWLQWCLDRQLAEAAEPVHLMRDLPVGASPHGFDAWSDQDLLARGVTVGAPPDALGPHGQDWQLPAYVPWKLRAAGYEPFAQTVRASLRHAGALRIDHALGLFRLFWIPPDRTPADGAYVSQPTDDLFDVLALESHRARAVIVGEDLGTVGPGVRAALHDRRMLRYHVGWFEDDHPRAWAPDSLASLSTHDLPTVAGVWSGEDEQELAAIGQEPDAAWFQELRSKLATTAGDALAPSLDDGSASVDDVLVAAHRWLASAPSAIVLGQLEDLLAVTRRPNVPGTQPPTRDNWSNPLPVPLDDLRHDARARAILDALGGAAAR